MPVVNPNYSKMLFNYETTNLTDYSKPEFEPPVTTEYKAKPGCQALRPKPLRDVHTMSEWKAQAIPFNLLLQHKPIVQSNPWTVQKKYDFIEIFMTTQERVTLNDEEHAHVIKTRPRLVMTPAVSMDDIEEPRARRVLCHDMYSSSAARAQREAAGAWLNVRAPLPDHPAPANPITLAKLQPPLVPPEWRMETVTWDNRQLRTHCDPTREFWLRSALPKCQACDETTVITSHRTKLRQQKKK